MPTIKFNKTFSVPKIIVTFLKGICLTLAALTLATPAHAQLVTKFFAFPNDKTQGSRPTGSLIQATDGDLYSTTQNEGQVSGGLGVVFKISTNGTFTKLKTFNTGADGVFPTAGVVQGTNDGNFYGTTFIGTLPLLRGSIYRMTPAGEVTNLVTFIGTNGFYPNCALVQGANGNFYGTTTGGTTNEGAFAGGGTNSVAVTNGTIFMVTPSGALTTLVAFAEINGKNPVAGLVLHSNGNFYGTTQNGGTNGLGTVYQMTPGGTLTSLYSFAGIDGANPFGGLTIGTNGNLYGTTQGGGLNSFGTIFTITTSGTLTTLVNFDDVNGSAPKAAPKQASNGYFYGTTSTGGTAIPPGSARGTVYQLAPNGTLTTLYTFQGYNFPSGFPSDGATPEADLMQASDGNLYGTTRAGGSANNCGTVFKVDLRPLLTSTLIGTDIVLSWLDYATGYTVQSATNLNSPIGWVDLTNAPVVVDGRFVVTDAVSGDAKFYRLKK